MNKKPSITISGIFLCIITFVAAYRIIFYPSPTSKEENAVVEADFYEGVKDRKETKHGKVACTGQNFFQAKKDEKYVYMDCGLYANKRDQTDVSGFYTAVILRYDEKGKVYYHNADVYIQPEKYNFLGKLRSKFWFTKNKAAQRQMKLTYLEAQKKFQ